MKNVKNFWKKLKYWQKAGIITAGIYLLIAIPSLIEFIINMNKSDMGTIGYWIIMILSFFGFLDIYGSIHHLISNQFHTQNEISSLIALIIIFTLIYFMVGVLVSIIMKKKKRKK